MAYNYHQTGQGIVIGHWSLVISKEAEAEKRRKEAGDSFAEIGLAICDLEFEIWDFSHLAVRPSKTKK